MKNVKFILTLVLMVVMGEVVCAQDSVAVKKVEPKGKAIITVFAGLGMDVQSGVTKVNSMPMRFMVTANRL